MMGLVVWLDSSPLYTSLLGTLIDIGILDVGLIEGYTMLCLDSTQVELSKFRLLLGSYIKIAFEMCNQAGVGAIVEIGADKVIS